MPDVGTAWVSLAVSARGLQRNLEKQLGDAGASSGERFSSEFDNAASKGRGIEDVANKALLFSGAAAAGFAGLAFAASDLEESVNAVSVRFGQFGDAAVDGILSASDAAQDFGLSSAGFNQAAVSFSGFAEQVGTSGAEIADITTDLIGRAADFASVFNLDVNEAMLVFQSTLAGQTEPIRRFGIDISAAAIQAHALETGIIGSAREMTEAEKVTARFSLLMQETSFAAGDFENTSDGLANSVRRLKGQVGDIAADFGAPIVGFASGLVGAISGSLGFLQDWNEETGGMLATGLAAGVGIAAASSAAVGVAGKVKGAVKAFRNLSRGLQVTAGAVGALALGVAAGFVVYGLLTQRSREVAARTREVGAALRGATGEAFEYAEQAAGATGALDGLAVAQHALSIALTTSGEDGEALVQTLGAIGVQSDDAFTTLFNVAQNGIGALKDIALQADFTGEQAEILSAAAIEIGEGWPLASGRAQEAIGRIADAFGLTTEEVTNFLVENQSFLQGLEDVQDAAGDQDLDALAEQFLNGAVAASEEAEALVKEAEARAAANDVADSSIDTYNELVALVAELPEHQRNAALEALGLAEAQSDAADAGEEMNSVSASTIEVMSDAERAAADYESRVNALVDAFDEVIGTTLDVREAYLDWKDAVAEVTAAVEEESFTLDRNTEAGRENERVVLDGVSAILDFAEASLDAGAGTERTTTAMESQRDEMIDALIPAFNGSREAAEDYIDQLGLTPEAIETAVRLANVETAKREVQEHLDRLDDIPESQRTAIQALIDDGAYFTALDRLRALEQPRFTTVFVRTNTAGFSPGVSQQFVAFGGYFEGNSPESVVIGEAPWDEAVLTVGNQANLRKQLEDDRIRGPLLEALSLDDVRLHATRTGGGTVNINHYGQTVTPATVAAAMRMARVSA